MRTIDHGGRRVVESIWNVGAGDPSSRSVIRGIPLWLTSPHSLRGSSVK